MGGTHPIYKKINSTGSCVPGCLNLATLLLYNPTLMKGNKMIIRKNEKGFNYKGQFITNPFISPCGRFDVNPKKYYGLTEEEVKQIKEESK